jgi:hypothetical protein
VQLPNEDDAKERVDESLAKPKAAPEADSAKPAAPAK